MTRILPQVAIVGRTNAGKSTLFNRLSESNKAIVSSMPNTTRDRNFADIAWQDHLFTLVDTGGLDTAHQDQLGEEIQKQVNSAITDAKIIIFLIDGSAPLMPQDMEIAKLLNKHREKIILGINKIDNQKKEDEIEPDFHKLNFKHVAKFSSKNGRQTGHLLDMICELLPVQTDLDPILQKHRYFKLAIIGRPNVGKSSLINAIIGMEKVIVSDLPHTTRDINDIALNYKNKEILLLDTAGIRRKSRVGGSSEKLLNRIEKQSIQAAITALLEADVVAIVVEAQKAVTAQDQALVNLALAHRKNFLLVINKWDLIDEKTENTINDFTHYFDSKFSLAKWVPLIFVSALNKQRVRKILDLALEISDESNKIIDQHDLDQLLFDLMQKHRPKIKGQAFFGREKKELKIKSLLQLKTDPPVFIIKTPNPLNVAPAFLKIIEKEIRQRWEFTGVPVTITIDK